MRLQRAQPPARLTGVRAARQFFAPFFEDPMIERLCVAHVDEQALCLHVERYTGDSDGVGIPIREIIVDAARFRSAGIILAHNHPSGRTRPSDADCRATRRLWLAAQALDISILDHLIFAGVECSSMRRLGLL